MSFLYFILYPRSLLVLVSCRISCILDQICMNFTLYPTRSNLVWISCFIYSATSIKFCMSFFYYICILDQIFSFLYCIWHPRSTLAWGLRYILGEIVYEFLVQYFVSSIKSCKSVTLYPKSNYIWVSFIIFCILHPLFYWLLRCTLGQIFYVLSGFVLCILREILYIYCMSVLYCFLYYRSNFVWFSYKILYPRSNLY